MAGNHISSEELEKHKRLMAAVVTGPSAWSSLLFSNSKAEESETATVVVPVQAALAVPVQTAPVVAVQEAPVARSAPVYENISDAELDIVIEVSSDS